MGFWDRFKRRKEAPEEVFLETRETEADTLGYVLFDRADVPVKALEEAVVKTFGKESLLQVDQSHPDAVQLLLRLGGEWEFQCTYKPVPLPEEEGDISKLLNFHHFRSAEEREALANHQSFLLVAQRGGGVSLEKKREICLHLSRLCGALMQIQGAAGFFNGGIQLLVSREAYLQHVTVIEQEWGHPDYFPSRLWVLVYRLQAEDGKPAIETRGLNQFGLMELQFYHPKRSWTASYEKLYMMASLEITGKEFYQDGGSFSFMRGEVSSFKRCGEKLVVFGGI